MPSPTSFLRNRIGWKLPLRPAAIFDAGAADMVENLCLALNSRGRSFKTSLSDAKAAGISRIRFYGGEPLLHRDLPKMVAYASEIRLNSYVTTNGILLKEKVDALYDAGFRYMTVGFYGVGQKYDNYVQRMDQFRCLETGLDYARHRYGDRLSFRLNWLLNRQTCSLDDLYEAWDFAKSTR